MLPAGNHPRAERQCKTRIALKADIVVQVCTDRNRYEMSSRSVYPLPGTQSHKEVKNRNISHYISVAAPERFKVTAQYQHRVRKQVVVVLNAEYVAYYISH